MKNKLGLLGNTEKLKILTFINRRYTFVRNFNVYPLHPQHNNQHVPIRLK